MQSAQVYEPYTPHLKLTPVRGFCFALALPRFASCDRLRPFFEFLMHAPLRQRFVPALVFARARRPALSVELTARVVEASSARRAAGHHHAVIAP